MSKKFSVDQWLEDVESVDYKDRKRRRKDRSKAGEVVTAAVWVAEADWDEMDVEQYHRRRKTRRTRRITQVDH